MRKLLLPVAATILIASNAAFAADLPVRSAAPAPIYEAPLFTWTGFYVGVSGGYAGDKFNYPLTVTGAPVSASANVTSSGFLAGGTIGYNHQFANNMVIGVEADWSWADVRGQIGLNANLAGLGVGATAGSTLTDIGTARVRLGYAWDRALIYATGGFAWANVDSGLSANLGGAAFNISRSNNVSGWAVGGGLEYLLGGNWSFKTEYLFVNLGKGTLLNANLGVVNLNLGVEPTMHIVRAGLNYNFGGLGGQIARAPVGPTVNWSGFYVGVSGGYAGDKFTYPLTVTGAPVSASANVTSSGFLVGGTLGYNYQFANNFLLGVEADWSLADVKGQIGLSANLAGLGVSATAGSKLTDLGTVRARAGYAFGRTLLYATGGFAWGSVDSGLSANLGGAGFSISRGNNVSGWVVGGGLEYAMSRNWSFKTEYLYTDLGQGTLLNVNVGALAAPVNIRLGVEPTLHTVRVGLNYRFGGAAEAVVAKY